MLPSAFTSSLRMLLGDDRYARFETALSEESPVSIRINPAKVPSISASVPDGQPVPWCTEGRYLSARPQFTFDPLLHAGCYYVQEAASMFITHVLRQYGNPLWHFALDLCAAPGGKSTAARTVLPADCWLVSNDPVALRAQVLAENIEKWGHDRCIVTAQLPKEIRRQGLLFDLIICDAPCSGEGMFRKDPNAVGEWSPQSVSRCAALQRDILSEAWQCLQPDGLLVYSTCTFNTTENEDNVLWALSELGAELLPVDTDPSWGILPSLSPELQGPVYRFMPGFTRSEGLFVAVLRKPADGSRRTVTDDRFIKSVRKLRPVYDSSDAATRRLFPTEAPAALPAVALSYPQAIAYLRREAIVLPPDAPRGIVTLTFRDIPIGLAKNLGNRANNLYPKEWRIRTTHTPDEYQPIV